LKKIIIAAVAHNGIIGRSSGEMPWHSKEEFQHFKNTTIGFPVIMGRKTFESLGAPLKGRLNIVLTGNNDLKNSFPEIVIFNNITDTYIYCEEKKFEKIFLTGGGSLFPVFINDADEMIISVMDFEAVGDIYFPEIDRNIWEIKNSEKRNEFEIFIYVRKENNER
jgi:dihydrofolate reductase